MIQDKSIQESLDDNQTEMDDLTTVCRECWYKVNESNQWEWL
jgi:hypothetical protein